MQKISFLAFFLMWAKRNKWTVPPIHVRACHWLEHKGELAVLRCFRGFGKSTILAVYNAWLFFEDPQYRLLHQSESDGTAYKTSRDTQNVLRNHPLTKGMLPDKQGTIEQWWVVGATDLRNASMYSKGILSNVTSARADQCQNDDVEVPRNIQTPEAREKLRYRLGEQIHIMVPGASQLFVGTPHTHDSIYDEIEALGADCLTIKMFEQEYRLDNADKSTYSLPFVPVYVFSGIGKHASLLAEGKDYLLDGKKITFNSPPNALLDFYGESAWPARFTREDLLGRRRKTRTINAWDSQYQLHSKPVSETRLDPDKMIAYDVEPVIKMANGEVSMWLGYMQIVSATAYWDCSLGKISSDAGAFTIIFCDDRGNIYWHRSNKIMGELAVFDEGNQNIIDGQVIQVRDLVVQFQIPKVTVEVNGVGGFVPTILRAALKGTGCAVGEECSSVNKQKRILDALEPPLLSGCLWAHTSVIEGDAAVQMRDFNPVLTTQPDDCIDSAAGAIKQQPVRIGKSVRNPTAEVREDWRPNSGTHEMDKFY